MENETEGGFRLIKKNNLCQQVWTTNQNPQQNLPQACRGRKSVCLVWICPTDNFLSHTRTSIRINNQWYDKPIQTSKKSTMVILKQKPQREVPQITSKNESIQKSLKKWFPFNWLAIKMLKYTRIIITLKY